MPTLATKYLKGKIYKTNIKNNLLGLFAKFFNLLEGSSVI